MRRREFIAGVLLTGMMRRVQAQPSGKLVRIGVLMAEPFQPLQSLRQELHRLGYVEGRNLRFEYRFAEHGDDQYPTLARSNESTSARTAPSQIRANAKAVMPIV